jgi:hypothetical protein
MHPVRNKGTKVILQKNGAKKLTLRPEYKVLCSGKSTTSTRTTLHIFMVVAASCYGYACHRQGPEEAELQF